MNVQVEHVQSLTIVFGSSKTRKKFFIQNNTKIKPIDVNLAWTKWTDYYFYYYYNKNFRNAILLFNLIFQNHDSRCERIENNSNKNLVPDIISVGQSK